MSSHKIANKTIDRLYICDGHGCKRNCAETMTVEEWAEYECHHTTDEKHAENKIRRNRKFKLTTLGGHQAYVET